MPTELDPTIILRGSQPIAPIDPMKIMAQVGELRQQQQQMATAQSLEAERRAKLAKDAKDQADQAAAEKAFNEAFQKNEDGSVTLNRDTLSNSLIKLGQAHNVPVVLGKLDSFDKSAADARKAVADAKKAAAEAFSNQINATAHLLDSVEVAGYTPVSALTANKLLADNGIITPETAKAFEAEIKADPSPENVKALVDQARAKSASWQKQHTEQMNAATSAKNAETAAGELASQVPLRAAQTEHLNLENAGTLPMTPAQIAQDQRVREQNALMAGERADKKQVAKSLVQDNAQQIVAGNLPVTLLSRRGTEYNETLAEANRINKELTGKPLNIGQLQIDYEAAKKFANNMNSGQMTRYRGLADSVVNTINEVNDLADQLKQGDIQKWNSVKRSTIQQVYGNSPQSELANRYVVAVNTLKEEFANLANGGFAPTDAAWKLANEQINKDFGFKDMRSSLSEVQRLINFRTHAMTNLTPITSTTPATVPQGTTKPTVDDLIKKYGGSGGR